MQTKICTKCKIEKELSEFQKDSQKPDGHRPDCKSCRKLYQIINKSKISKQKRQFRKLNKEKIRKQKRKYYDKNKEKIIQKYKVYYKENKVKISKRTLKWYNKKRKNNIGFRILCNLRGRIYHSLKNNFKGKKTKELLGCSIEHLKNHLESMFQEGMSWNNYGKWHIDHIKPCASFDLADPDQQRICFNYKNLQPLWAIDNLSKGARNVFSASIN